MQTNKNLSNSPNLPIRISAYGLLIADGKVLMCETISGTRIIINFPGGAIDQDEKLEDAVVREFYEETKAEVSIQKFLHASDGTFINPDYPGNYVQANYFLVSSKTNQFDCSEAFDVKGLKWYNLDQLPFDQMLEVDAKFCKMLSELL